MNIFKLFKKGSKLEYAKELQGKRNEFKNNIVFFFVGCGTPSNPTDDKELKTYRNFIPDLLGFGIEEYREKLNELLDEEDEEKISDFERKLDQLYNEYVYERDDVSVPAGMCVPAGISITLVVRDGKEYRVMKLS